MSGTARIGTVRAGIGVNIAETSKTVRLRARRDVQDAELVVR